MDRNGFRFGAVTLSIVAAAVGCAVAAFFIVTIFRTETADFRGGAAQTEQVHADGSYRIAAYDAFFAQCAGIQAKEGALTALKAELADAATTPERASQLRAIITAVTASRRADIATYNTDAAKWGTKAQFLSSTLPYDIDPNQEHTTCVIR